MNSTMLEPEQYLTLAALYADYAAVLDAGEWDRWPDFFTEDCSYRLQARENFDRGLPLATLSFESKGMLKDRAYGIRETLFHDPYYQRHVLGLPRILKVVGDDIHCEANYAVFRTKPSELTQVFNVGRYVDTVRRTGSGLRFATKLCVFDSELIPNAIIYPI
jgi:salicylate 5-hydroxylase small subunit